MIGASLLLAASLPSSLLTGLVGGWKLDGNGNDVLGVSNGVVEGTGGTWNTGKLGSAFYTGGLARVNVGGAAQIKPTTAISIAAWCWFTASPGGNARCLSDWHQDGAKDRWILGYSPDGVSLYGHAGANCLLGTFGASIGYGAWHLLTLTCGFISLGAYAMTTYLNGAQVATATGSTIFRSGAGNVCFGLQEEAGAGLNGRIDEVYMWDRAITAPEVLDLHNAGVGKTHPF